MWEEVELGEVEDLVRGAQQLNAKEFENTSLVDDGNAPEWPCEKMNCAGKCLLLFYWYKGQLLARCRYKNEGKRGFKIPSKRGRRRFQRRD